MFKNLVLAIFFLLCTNPIFSQKSDSTKTAKADKNFQFMPIPYLTYDRSLGLSYGAMPIAMYKVNQKDTISPASLTGLFGMYTTNKSYFAVAFQQLYLREDRWRIKLAAGFGSINFQTYVSPPIDGFLDYNTGVSFFYSEVLRRVYKDIYLGAGYIYSELESEIGENFSTPKQYLNSITYVVAVDKRDDVYYPKTGSLSNANFNTYPAFLGNEDDIIRTEVDHTHYINVRDSNDVIAARFYGGFGIGDVPFEQQFIIGNSDLRGYTQGKYRGEQAMALQGEYRWNFWSRWSVVGFGGIATVFGSRDESQDGQILPAIGTGFRYNIVEKYHMNVGLDFAVGKDDWGMYFRIGEAF